MLEEKEISETEKKDIILNDLKNEWKIEEDVSFNEFTIQEKLQNHVFILMKYQKQLEKEKYSFGRMNEMRDEILGKQYDYYRFNYDSTLTKAEIEKYYLPRDPKIVKINKLIRLQEVRVNFFDICVRALEKVRLKYEKFPRST